MKIIKYSYPPVSIFRLGRGKLLSRHRTYSDHRNLSTTSRFETVFVYGGEFRRCFLFLLTVLTTNKLATVTSLNTSKSWRCEGKVFLRRSIHVLQSFSPQCLMTVLHSSQEVHVVVVHPRIPSQATVSVCRL